MRELHDGWRLVKLEEVVTPFNGYWGSETATPDSRVVLVLGVGNISNDGFIRLDGALPRYLAQNESEAIAQDGNLLVVKSSGSATNIRSGKAGLCPAELSGKIACSNFMIRLAVDRDQADPYLLWQILNSDHAKKFIRLIAGSTTYPNIKWSSYKDYSFPLPPLPEQRRIAGVLREQMATVDAARHSAEAQLEAGQALPAAYLRAVFANREAQEWPRKRIGDLCEVKGGKRLPAGADFADRVTRFPYIRVVDFQGGNVKVDNLKYLDESTQKAITRYIINRGDVYISIAGSTGIVGVIPDELNGANLTENAARLVIRDREHLERDFLAAFLQSASGQEQIDHRTNKVGQPKLALERIETIEVPIPDCLEQRQIAAELAERLAGVERLRRALEEQLAAIEALPAALLRRAFSGELSGTPG